MNVYSCFWAWCVYCSRVVFAPTPVFPRHSNRVRFYFPALRSVLLSVCLLRFLSFLSPNKPESITDFSPHSHPSPSFPRWGFSERYCCWAVWVSGAESAAKAFKARAHGVLRVWAYGWDTIRVFPCVSLFFVLSLSSLLTLARFLL